MLKLTPTLHQRKQCHQFEPQPKQPQRQNHQHTRIPPSTKSPNLNNNPKPHNSPKRQNESRETGQYWPKHRSLNFQLVIILTLYFQKYQSK